MGYDDYMSENSNIGICVGAFIGIDKKHNYKSARYVIKVTDISDTHIYGIYQSDQGKSSLDTYWCSQVIKLPLIDEVLDLTDFFTKVNNEWKSSDSLVIISKNPEEFKKKWNIKIFDENHNLVFYSIFEYLHELQFFCFLNNVELTLKYGSIRILYKDYLDNI